MISLVFIVILVNGSVFHEFPEISFVSTCWYLDTSRPTPHNECPRLHLAITTQGFAGEHRSCPTPPRQYSCLERESLIISCMMNMYSNTQALTFVIPDAR